MAERIELCGGSGEVFHAGRPWVDLEVESDA